MDELRNMLRQSFNLPVEPVGVVDEKKVDGWSPEEKNKNYSNVMLKKVGRSGKMVWRGNFGQMFEPLFALSVAFYLHNGTINHNQIFEAASRLRHFKDAYSYGELFKELTPDEIAADKMRSTKGEIGRRLKDQIRSRMENYLRVKNPDDSIEVKPLAGKVEEIPSDGKTYYVVINSIRIPGDAAFGKEARIKASKGEKERIDVLAIKYDKEKFLNPRGKASMEVDKQIEIEADSIWEELSDTAVKTAVSKLENTLEKNPNVYDCTEPNLAKHQGGANLFYIYKIFDYSEKAQAEAFAARTDLLVEVALPKSKEPVFKIDFQFSQKKSEEVNPVVPLMQYFIDHKDAPLGASEDDEKSEVKKTKEEQKEEKLLTGYAKLKKYIGFIEANIKDIGPIDEAKKHFDSLKIKGNPNVSIVTIGSEGMEGDTKGEIKGDIAVTIGELPYRFSLKAGNRSVASLGSEHIFYKYINIALTYAGLKDATPWNPTANAFSIEKPDKNKKSKGEDDTGKSLDPRLLDTFQKTCLKLNSNTADKVKRGNKCNKLLFCLLDTLAHGLDDSTLVSLTVTSGEIKTLSPSISEYIRAMNAETKSFAAGAGVRFVIYDIDKADEKNPKVKKSYGIMTINKSGKVEINSDLEELLKELKNVFGPDADEDRKMLWSICRQVSYCNIIRQKIGSTKSEISKPIIDKIDFYHKQVNNILGLYGSAKLHDEAISNKVTTENYIDSLTKLKLYDYAFGKSNKVDEKILHSFLVGMANKLHMYLTSMEASMKKLKVAK